MKEWTWLTIALMGAAAVDTGVTFGIKASPMILALGTIVAALLTVAHAVSERKGED